MSTTLDCDSTAEAVIVLTRIFDAPRETVWQALTDPRHVSIWFGGQGFTNPRCEMDVRVGGQWHHVMRAPDGSEYPIDSVYLEVTPPERLVWTAVEDTGGGKPAPINTVTLEDLGGRTKWTMVAKFKSIHDRDIAVGMGFGQMVAQGVERLAEHLKTM
jgi:uncharacterized protein YndB with AHSA1/START domain